MSEPPPEVGAIPEVPAHAASRARDRLEPLSWAHDWDGVRAALAPEFRWEDRRPMMRFEGGADLLVKNMEMTRMTDEVRHDRQLIATRGDRIALEAITGRPVPRSRTSSSRCSRSTASRGPTPFSKPHPAHLRRYNRSFINLFLVDDATIIAVELFDLEDLDRALARFNELRPDSP